MHQGTTPPRVTAVALAVLGVAAIVFACQTTGEGPMPEPTGKVLLAKLGPETELWVHPLIFLVGAVVLFVAVIVLLSTFTVGWKAYSVSLPVPALVLIAALLLLLWNASDR
jgi:hypothetical protein